MLKASRNTKGYALVELVIIFVVLVALVGVGVYASLSSQYVGGVIHVYAATSAGAGVVHVYAVTDAGSSLITNTRAMSRLRILPR